MIYKLVRWRQYGPQKCCYFPTSPHGDTTDKTNMDMSISYMFTLCTFCKEHIKTNSKTKTSKPTKLANSERSSFFELISLRKLQK